jgi:hypothetical protein
MPSVRSEHLQLQRRDAAPFHSPSQIPLCQHQAVPDHRQVHQWGSPEDLAVSFAESREDHSCSSCWDKTDRAKDSDGSRIP